ncbi:hypothetical protein [Lysobacter gummosus]
MIKERVLDAYRAVNSESATIPKAPTHNIGKSNASCPSVTARRAAL